MAASYTQIGGGFTVTSDSEFESRLICSAGVTLELRTATINGLTTGTVTFYDTLTGLEVAAPALWTEGACPILKIPDTTFVNAPALSTTASSNLIASGVYREFQVFNRSTVDLVISWTSTGGGGGTLKVPALGTELLSLATDPDEMLLGTLTLSTVTGTTVADAVFINLKN